MKIPPAIRTEFNWGEEFRDIVVGYPVDAHCMAVAGCDNTVAYHADFHGCTQELLCAHHLTEWANQITMRITVFGSVVCMDCNTDFTSALAFAHVRTV